MTEQQKPFEEMIVNAVKGYCEHQLQETLEARVNKLLDDLLGDLFRSYGDLAKGLKEKVEQELAVDLQRLDFSQYREELLAITQRRVEAAWNEQMKEAVEASLSQILAEPPKELKLSEIVEMMKSDRMEHRDDGDWPSECTAYVEYDRGVVEGFAMVFLDPEPDKSGYECSYRIHIHNKEEGWEAIGVHLPDLELGRHRGRFLGRLDALEKALFHLHASGTKLVLDEDCVDDAYPDPFD